VSVDVRFELQQAIVENQLVLHYQPIVTTRERTLVAVEALVRWRHPTRGILPPSQFIPALERAGLARDLTLWVLREAILQTAVWKRDRQPLAVTVNMSPENLRDPHFRRLLDITLRAVGSPELLIAEIPAATLTSPAQLTSLSLMREKGIRVAIDDVVELAPLADIPADILKIGRSLTSRAAVEPAARAAFDAIVAAAKAQTLSVTAVGVESEAMWPIVRECDTVQGYAIAQALSTSDLDVWRRRR
jgi:EAL domain-containing protein (putative c-di-GMP-specific phosphodiesterase class I)